MSNIRISTLDKINKSFQPYSYVDLNLDIEVDSTKNNQLLKIQEVKDLRADYDFAAIRNSIFNIFTTIPGQKILAPEFGLNLTQFLFEAVNESTAQDIADAIIKGISDYEPRVNLLKIDIKMNMEDQEYVITMVIQVPSIKNREFVLEGTLSNSSFYFSPN